MEDWTKLFGKSQDDPKLKAALASAGVKKVPKLKKDWTFVVFDLKGHGLGLRMTDEAYLKDLDDIEIGEGSLILSGEMAYLDTKVSNDLYKGTLPYKLAAGMSRAEVRKAMGRPTRSTDEDDPPLLDAWLRDGLEVIATYSKAEKLVILGLRLPGS